MNDIMTGRNMSAAHLKCSARIPFFEEASHMKFCNFLNRRKPAWLVTAIGFLTALAAFFFLPGEIPTHWNSFGVADGYGSRLFIFL